MFYEYTLTIPANTPATRPVTQDVELDHGRIVAVEVQFPRGCFALAHVQVRHGPHPLWPTNVDGNIAGEDARIAWQEDYPFTEAPYTLTLRGWNLDDSFPHTVTFRFNLLPLAAPAPPPPPGPGEAGILEMLELP